ncbi:unknown protein [Paenibacillus amylolyticus]|uniref:Uncharacterized protein n=1 Tax=Paenibacillus amylolyticus TaxID=1451 RepID=A0A100VT28_PAEAM|nr:unknown protein [Paenibacillus amylolyticus]
MGRCPVKSEIKAFGQLKHKRTLCISVDMKRRGYTKGSYIMQGTDMILCP